MEGLPGVGRDGLGEPQTITLWVGAAHIGRSLAPELYFTVDDVHGFIERMKQHGLSCSEVHQERWGLLTQVTLPGGGLLGVYEPRHERPAKTA